jgi:hypothetical protein
VDRVEANGLGGGAAAVPPAACAEGARYLVSLPEALIAGGATQERTRI